MKLTISSPGKEAGFARNVLSNWGTFLFSAVVGFFLAPYVVNTLGDSAYGIWVLLASVVGYLGLLDLGVRGAVTKYVAEYHAAGDDEAASRIASAAFRMFVLAGAIAIAVSAVGTPLIEHAFEIPPSLLREARLVLLISGASIAVSIMGGVYGGIVTGTQRFDVANAINVAVEAVRAALIVAALTAGYTLVALALVQLLTAVLRLALLAVASRLLYAALRITTAIATPGARRTILSFGLFSVMLHLADRISLYTDSLVISTYLPVAMVTPFAIGASLIEYGRGLLTGLSYVVTPRVSAIQGRAPGGPELTRVVLLTGRVATLVVLPMTITFWIRGPAFLGLWMGPQYAGPSGEILRILALAFTFSAAATVGGSSVMGVAKHRGLIPAMWAECLLNLGISIVLVRYWSITGVAWGTALPRLAIALGFLPWYLRRVFGIPIRTQFAHHFLQPIAAMIPFAACTWAIETLWPAEGLLIFFLQVAAALPAAVAGTLLVGLERSERESLIGSVRNRLRTRERPPNQ